MGDRVWVAEDGEAMSAGRLPGDLSAFTVTVADRFGVTVYRPGEALVIIGEHEYPATTCPICAAVDAYRASFRRWIL